MSRGRNPAGRRRLNADTMRKSSARHISRANVSYWGASTQSKQRDLLLSQRNDVSVALT